MNNEAAKRFNPHKNISALKPAIANHLYGITSKEIKIVEGKK